MLLPALSKAKQKAQQTGRVNTQQMALAIMYQHDTDKPIDYTTVDTLWMKTLIDYQAKVAAIRLCPTASATNRANGQGDATYPLVVEFRRESDVWELCHQWLVLPL